MTRPLTLSATASGPQEYHAPTESGGGSPGSPERAHFGAGGRELHTAARPVAGGYRPCAPARAGLTRFRASRSLAPAELGLGAAQGVWGLFVASQPLCNRCFSRVRQRQSACCCREKIRRAPSGAGKISPSICVPPHTPARPRLVSRPLRQSGKRHQRRRAAFPAAQPADPSKVTATSGSTSSAPARPPPAKDASPRAAPSGAPPSAIHCNRRCRERKGAPHSPRGGGDVRSSAPPSCPCLGPGGAAPPPPPGPHHSSL